MPEYKLTYFNGLGIAEPIRLLLHFLERPFEDVRMNFEDWTPQAKSGIPWGKVPVLEIDGKQVNQSMAICRYLGREAGLAGDEPWESLQIDVMGDTVVDMSREFSSSFKEPDEELKKQKRDKFYSETLPFYLGKFNDVIKENDGHLVSGKLSWADLVLINQCQMYSLVADKDVTEPYPELQGLLHKVSGHPKLAEYIKNRPKTEF